MKKKLETNRVKVLNSTGHRVPSFTVNCKSIQSTRLALLLWPAAAITSQLEKQTFRIVSSILGLTKSVIRQQLGTQRNAL